MRMTVPKWMKKKGPDDLLPRKERPLSPSSPESSSGTRNFAIKFLLDQTAGALLNITLFIVSINLLKGEGPVRIWELIGEVRYVLSPPSLCMQQGANIVGFSSYHDGSAQVSPCRFDADVHCCAG